jgi:hypothetical protein
VPGSVVNHRLEGHTRGTDLVPGLQARVHDALWLLARQRQLGEFDGLDAGTPVSAALVVRAVPLAAWQPSGGAKAQFAPVAPLEALVESDGGPLLWRDRVAAGLRLARAFRRANLNPAALSNAHPLAQPDPAVTPDASVAAHATSAVTPDEVMAVGAIAAGRVPDPAAVAAAWDANANALVAAVGGEAARAPLMAWRAWWRSRTPTTAGAWQTADLSYELTAMTADPLLPVYRAERFEGGSLDWYAFDALPPAVASGVPAGPAAVTTRAVPVPVGFHGAPVGRYWQLDDARTDLGAIETYPTELAKLLLAEFTACFAGDWFRVPVRIAYGSAARVQALVSNDTFGVSALVPPAAAGTGTKLWHLYEHSTPSGVADGSWLLVPPVLAGSVDSAPVEEIALVRDPAADLVWGIESVVTNAVGRPVRRADDLAAQGREPPPDPRPGLAGAWIWRLATNVPENWIPFLPTRGRAPTDDYGLVQGSMVRYERATDGTLTSTPILPASLLLRETRSMPERNVPREGLSCFRSRRLARTLDGRRVLWWSRAVSIGHGEASSGLAYDGLHATSDDPTAIGQ